MKENLNNVELPKNEISLFHTSIISNQALAIMRFFFFVEFTIAYILRLAFPQYPIKFQILYVTNQAFFLTWLYYTLAIFDYLFANQLTVEISIKIKKMATAVFETALIFQIIVTVIFYSVDNIGYKNELLFQKIMDVNVHGAPLFALVLDFIFNPFSFNGKRFKIACFCGIISHSIMIGYSLLVQKIYNEITFRDLRSYLVLLGVYVTGLVCYFLGGLVFSYWKEPILKNKLKMMKEIDQKDYLLFQ